MSRNPLIPALLLTTSVVLADEAAEAKPVAAATETAEPVAKAAEAQAQSEKDAKELSGMSVLGNQEAPKALVIVPWKSSEIGDSLGISTMLDDSKQPVDKEVFMRALSYYEIRTDTTRQDGAPAGGRDSAAAETRDAAPPVSAAQRSKS